MVSARHVKLKAMMKSKYLPQLEKPEQHIFSECLVYRMLLPARGEPAPTLEKLKNLSLHHPANPYQEQDSHTLRGPYTWLRPKLAVTH